MADLKVDRASGLDLFLRRNGFQQWRILVLINCGGIKVIRDGADIPLKGAEKTHVDIDDIVRIPDPLPKGCQEAIQKEVDTNSRDYAFVPGKTGTEKESAGLMHVRPETMLVNDPFVRNPPFNDPMVGDDIVSFIRAFANSASITHPVRHLIVISHATPDGHLKIKMGGATDIEFEDLESAVKSKAIFLDEKLVMPRPGSADGGAMPAQFIIGGCRIGSQPVFLKKLKEALGSKIMVTAPKFFHEVATFPKPPGYIEFMGYNFRITRPKALTTKQAVIQEMIKESFPLIDEKTPVPNKAWDGWVPDQPEAKAEQVFQEPVFSPITNSRVTARRFFRYFERHLFKDNNRLSLTNDTGKEADRKKAVKAQLIQMPEFKDTHPFPRYKRYGYKTMDEFMAGWEWEFIPKNKSAPSVEYNAKRYEYTAIPPITEGPKHILVLNFFPSTRQGKVIENLLVTDKRFFETV